MAGLLITFDDGVLFTDETCRRGEVRLHPSWMAEPTPPIEASKARPIITKMGGNPPERRAVR